MGLHGKNGIRKYKFNIWAPNHFQKLALLPTVRTISIIGPGTAGVEPHNFDADMF